MYLYWLYNPQFIVYMQLKFDNRDVDKQEVFFIVVTTPHYKAGEDSGS